VRGDEPWASTAPKLHRRRQRRHDAAVRLASGRNSRAAGASAHERRGILFAGGDLATALAVYPDADEDQRPCRLDRGDPLALGG